MANDAFETIINFTFIKNDQIIITRAVHGQKDTWRPIVELSSEQKDETK